MNKTFNRKRGDNYAYQRYKLVFSTVSTLLLLLLQQVI
nr:MAG TPA: hypothetical protein [Microviridae sp.]